MKKSIIYLMAGSILMSSCSYAQYSGLMAGASAGSLLGGSIGMLKGGPRGHDRGTAIGILAGAVAGAAITTAVQNKAQQSSTRATSNSSYTATPTTSNHRYTLSTLPLSIQNLTFMDENGHPTTTLSRGQECRLYFELVNTSGTSIYQIEPAVYETSKNTQIAFSPSTRIESLGAGQTIRYSAIVRGMNRLKAGIARLGVAVSIDGSDYVDITTISIQTKK